MIYSKLLILTLFAMTLSGCWSDRPATPPNMKPVPEGKEMYTDASSEGAVIADLGVETWMSRKPDIAQNYVAVCFFNAYCPESRQALRNFAKLNKTYGDKKVELIAISDEPAPELLDFLKKNPALQNTVHFASDPQKRLYNTLRLFGTPHVIVIAPGTHALIWEGNPLQKDAQLTTDRLNAILHKPTAVNAK